MRRRGIPILCAAVCALASAHVHAWTDPVDAAAEIMPLAADSLKLGLAKSGDRYIAVGGRGEIVYSADAKTWKQAQVPTRATFTAVAAVDANVWAVGHEGVIAHSADSGEHWTLQRRDALKIGGDVDEATRDPQRGAPLLGVLFTDTQHGMVVGAYSLALRTDDGGEHWNPMIVASPSDNAAAKKAEDIDDDDAVPARNDGKMTFSAKDLKIGEEATPHLNAIARTSSGGLVIVGERGSAFQSHDDGKTWKRIQLPYDGSMFGVLGYDGDHALAFGLRGHVYETADLGTHWAEVETKTELTLLGGTALPDGGAVIVGANGIILARMNGHDELHGFIDTPAGVLAAVMPVADKTILVAGENGLSTYSPH
jgi:photosystem II stability/assembly factor-like uncharacterized protein